MEKVRIYEIPACKMVSSGGGMFGEPAFDQFDAWFSAFPRTMFPKDFLFQQPDGKFNWLYLYEDGMDVPDAFSIIDFPGGLYGVATDVDGTSNEEALSSILQFAKAHGFAPDPSRAYLGNVITPPAAGDVMGYVQMDYYIPLIANAK